MGEVESILLRAKKQRLKSPRCTRKGFGMYGNQRFVVSYHGYVAAISVIVEFL